mmetsp:Transcript_27982/g.109902  ORF Transcript_27982/g.109902 Transcript_27982/m.109902 type:complete len:157 (+) Transcript_27982:321-791(+)
MQLHKSPQTRNQQRQASETVNIEQSLTLTKNLVRTSISSIAYIRNLFPDDCFTEQHIGGMKLQKLTGSDNGEAKLLIKWLEQGVMFLRLLVLFASACLTFVLYRSLMRWKRSISRPYCWRSLLGTQKASAGPLSTTLPNFLSSTDSLSLTPMTCRN